MQVYSARAGALIASLVLITSPVMAEDTEEAGDRSVDETEHSKNPPHELRRTSEERPKGPAEEESPRHRIDEHLRNQERLEVQPVEIPENLKEDQ
ncbi:hypothetical protein [Vreelandella utahensis]|uniref:hypothetical protein n=1 Tax=Vreelandella halophila TaxID=86177 RepID=UPI00117A4460|nr:hypothetical protein [Halomonas utahensis]